MKETDKIIDENLREKILKRVWNEYNYSKPDLESILSGQRLSEEKIRLFSSIIKSCSWYQLRSILKPKEMEEALSEPVLSILWPQTLQSRYRYASNILFRTTVSATG